MNYLHQLSKIQEKADSCLLTDTADLARVEANNALHYKYKHNYEISKQLHSELEEMKHNLVLERNILLMQAQLHEAVILKTIAYMATQKMRFLRPEDKYELRLESKMVDGYRYVHVDIKQEGESDDEFVPVKTDVGKFFKQLIATSICLTVAALMGHKELFMDEPVSNGSATSLLKLQKVISAYDMTFYIVDQKEEMFSKLKRREFYFLKIDDGSRGYTILQETKDVKAEEGLLDAVEYKAVSAG